MKLFVNEKEITLFEGAKVIDAVRMYGGTYECDVMQGKVEILDAYGNAVGLEGALHNGSRLFLRTKK